MKLPWVSRELYDATSKARNAWKATHDALVPLLAVKDEKYEALLDRYHALKVSGASAPEPTPTLQRPEFDPVQAAITAKAGPDKRLRAMMSREAMQSRAAGIPDIEIIQAIEQGVTVDEEDVA